MVAARWFRRIGFRKKVEEVKRVWGGGEVEEAV